MFFQVLQSASQCFAFDRFCVGKLGSASAGAVGTDLDLAQDWLCGDRGGEGAEWAVDCGRGGRDGKADRVAAG